MPSLSGTLISLPQEQRFHYLTKIFFGGLGITSGWFLIETKLVSVHLMPHLSQANLGGETLPLGGGGGTPESPLD